LFIIFNRNFIEESEKFGVLFSWKRLNVSIESAVKKRDIVAVNFKIKDAALKLERLSSSFRALEALLQAGLQPTVISYTSLINSCAHCGNGPLALQVFRFMSNPDFPEKAPQPVMPNEITFTALFKALCGDGMLEESHRILGEMKSMGVTPNIRTFTTILRGCVRHGDPDLAEEIVKEMKKMKQQPDDTAYNYLIECLCIAGRLERAWEVATEAESIGLSPESTSRYVSLAVASVIAEDSESAWKAIDYCNTCRRNPAKESAGPKDSEEGPSRSVGRFLGLKKREEQRECQAAKEYLLRNKLFAPSKKEAPKPNQRLQNNPSAPF